jgi:hypothetical protein
MKWTEEYAATVEKFWTSMSDFPDLNVVLNALCKRCKQHGRTRQTVCVPAKSAGRASTCSGPHLAADRCKCE